MANTLKDLGSVAITTSFATAYTVPGATKFVNGVLHIANSTQNPILVRVCKNGDLAANALLWDFSVPANDFIEFGRGLILSAAETLRVKADAAGLTLTGAGIEAS